LISLDSGNLISYSGTGSTWNDLEGVANNATLFNTPTYSSSYGGILQFDDVSLEYGTIPNIGNLTNWTVETWFRLTSPLTGKVTSIVSNIFNGSNLNFSIGTNNQPSNANLAVGFYNGSWRTTTGFTPTTNVWYQVVGTYDGTTIRQYVNGNLSGGTLNYVGTPTSGGDIRIMRRWDETLTSSNFIDGDLAIVKIYNRAISGSEVLQNYNDNYTRFIDPTPTPTPTTTVTPTNTVTPTISLTPTISITPTNTVTPTPTMGGLASGGLIFNLQTAPSTGTTWTDTSGNGYNATLQGTPTYVSNNGGGIRLNNTGPNGAGNDYISVPYNIASNTTTVEIVASFNPTGFWATIWGNESWTAGRGYLAYVEPATSINFGTPGGQTSETITASNAIRHWIFVINGTQASLFLNGSQVGTTDTIGNQTLFATSEFYFGARHVNNGIGPADRLNSSISANQPVFYQMRLYSRALSGSEITANFNAIKTTYGL
jgi:hypothetical protein